MTGLSRPKSRCYQGSVCVWQGKPRQTQHEVQLGGKDSREMNRRQKLQVGPSRVQGHRTRTAEPHPEACRPLVQPRRKSSHGLARPQNHFRRGGKTIFDGHVVGWFVEDLCTVPDAACLARNTRPNRQAPRCCAEEASLKNMPIWSFWGHAEPPFWGVTLFVCVCVCVCVRERER